MNKPGSVGGDRLEKWPDVEPWAELLWKALELKLGGPTRIGWGSARFRDCDVRLELSYPGPRMTIRVIDALPDISKLRYHTYFWGMGLLPDVAHEVAIERTLEMAEQLRADAHKRESER